MYTFEANLKHKRNGKGFLIASVFPKKSAEETTLDFPKNLNGMWSSEHLLLTSLNSCLMTTFLTNARNSNIQIVKFESNASCTIDVVNGKHLITEIILRPKVIIPYFQNPELVKSILEISKNSCLLSSIIKKNIYLKPEISIELTLISKEKNYNWG